MRIQLDIVMRIVVTSGICYLFQCLQTTIVSMPPIISEYISRLGLLIVTDATEWREYHIIKLSTVGIKCYMSIPKL